MNTQNRNHILVLPPGFLFLRIVQIILAVAALGLTAFLIAHDYSIFFPTSYGLAMFTSIATLIIIIYIIVAETAAPGAYNMWAILSLDIFAVVFWLGTMAALAAFRGSFTIPVEVYYGKRALLVADNIYLGIMVAAIITSAIEMILFIVSLATFGTRLHRYRLGNQLAEAHQMHAVPQSQQVPPQYQPQQFQPQYQQPDTKLHPQEAAFQPQYPQDSVELESRGYR